MKKLLLTIAVLIAAIIVSCGEPTAPYLTGSGPAASLAGSTIRTIAFTAVEAQDGTITLEYAPPAAKKSSRALSLDLAKAASDFYEVVFVDEDEGDLWRRNFKEGENVRMTINAGNYNNAGDYRAYMFAGRKVNGDNILLGVGQISKVEYKDSTPDATATNFPINANTYRVTFELEPLETNITRDFGNGTFKSWDAANTPGFPAANEAFVAGESVKYADICNVSVPVFTIPKDATTYGTIEVVNAFASAIKYNVTTQSAIAIRSAGFFQDGQDAPMADVVVAVKTGAGYANLNDPDTFYVADISLGSLTNFKGLRIPITMDAEDKDGLAVFTYEIPVYNYDKGASVNGTAATIWKLQGGITNNLYDLGPVVDSQGGKIILGVGDLSGINFITDTPDDDDSQDGFIVTPGWPQP